MLLCIFRHVEPYEFHSEFLSQHFCYFRLAYTGRTDEEQRCQRLVVFAQSCLRHEYGFGDFLHGIVLSEDAVLDVVAQTGEYGVVVLLEHVGFYLEVLHEYLVDESFRHVWLTYHKVFVDFEIGSRLVDEVDGLVGQPPVADVLLACPHGIVYGILVVDYVVELLQARLQTLYYLYGFLY